MSDDSMFIGPDLMTKYGAMLNETADLTDEILKEHRSGTSAFGKPWGHGDEIADLFEDKYVPGEQQLQDYLEVLSEVLRETTVNFLDTVEEYRRSEAFGIDTSKDLFKDLPGGPGGLPGGSGGLPGGSGRR
ncbi:hypothetical protein ACFOVU_07815 [Nocardiopsis sediminis]|uniref:WXG100 family type VII secretion target n=1 Tax=Nocardiopsis sediminis TaxID=1778267 RepID=A0ABV8FLP3_9ACTN